MILTLDTKDGGSIILDYYDTKIVVDLKDNIMDTFTFYSNVKDLWLQTAESTPLEHPICLLSYDILELSEGWDLEILSGSIVLPDKPKYVTVYREDEVAYKLYPPERETYRISLYCAENVINYKNCTDIEEYHSHIVFKNRNNKTTKLFTEGTPYAIEQEE